MSKKTTDLTEKTTPVADDTLTWLDSEDENLETKDKVFKLSNIWSAIFGSRTTDDIPEWTTNKYASTTNVDAAGATMNTDTSLMGNSWFLDEDNMASDDATKVPSQQSVKAYVDNLWTNVNWLTEDTVPDMDTDFNLEYDVDAWINKKYKMSSYRASETERIEETITNKFITPEQLAKSVSATWMIASDNLRASADTENIFNTTSWFAVYYKNKEIELGNYVDGWVIRVKFDLMLDSASPWDTIAYWRIYVNGSPIWTERTTSSNIYTTYSEDITVNSWDLVQLWLAESTSTWIKDVKTRNFRIYYDESYTYKTPVVNLD